MTTFLKGRECNGFAHTQRRRRLARAAEEEDLHNEGSAVSTSRYYFIFFCFCKWVGGVRVGCCRGGRRRGCRAVRRSESGWAIRVAGSGGGSGWGLARVARLGRARFSGPSERGAVGSHAGERRGEDLGSSCSRDQSRGRRTEGCGFFVRE